MRIHRNLLSSTNHLSSHQDVSSEQHAVSYRHRVSCIEQNEKQPADNISGGQKKLLELDHTMMVDAKVVLLDEAGASVNRTQLNSLTTNTTFNNKMKNWGEVANIRCSRTGSERSVRC